MAQHYSREEIQARFKASLQAGHPIVVASSGIGISAKFAEAGGADMIGLFNSDYLGLDRIEATSLMPYGNANDIVMSLGDRIFPVVRNVPMLGGDHWKRSDQRNDSLSEDYAIQGFFRCYQFPFSGFRLWPAPQ